MSRNVLEGRVLLGEQPFPQQRKKAP